MSARDFELELTQLAHEDFRDILSYAINRWGDRQRDIYRGKINNALSAIAENPLNGRLTRMDVRKVVVEKHCIYYSIKNRTVVVRRILHERMDEALHVNH